MKRELQLEECYGKVLMQGGGKMTVTERKIVLLAENFAFPLTAEERSELKRQLRFEIERARKEERERCAQNAMRERVLSSLTFRGERLLQDMEREIRQQIAAEIRAGHTVEETANE